MVFKFSSNHLPIVLTSEVIPLGPQPFQFFKAWCDYSELHTIVKKELEASGERVRNFWGRLKSD